MPKNDLHACLDALFTVYKGHLVTAACMKLGLGSPDDDLPEQSPVDTCVRNVASHVVDTFTIIPEAILGKPVDESGDGMYNYARVLCHYAALVSEFTDAWGEGDGERVLRCWKIFMLHFHADRRTKYALEALRLQFQLASLSPDLVHQLTWGRFVNTHGGLGRNIPSDLCNEHVNRLFKEIVGNMGANFTEQASTRAARAVTSLAKMSRRFDDVTGIHPESTAHSVKSDEDDVKHVVKVIQRTDALNIHSGRCHTKFSKMSTNPLKSLDRAKLHLWIKQKIKQQMKFRVMREGNTSDPEASDDES